MSGVKRVAIDLQRFEQDLQRRGEGLPDFRSGKRGRLANGRKLANPTCVMLDQVLTDEMRQVASAYSIEFSAVLRGTLDLGWPAFRQWLEQQAA